MAPRAGFEPATNRLTAERSTTELPGNAGDSERRAILRNLELCGVKEIRGNPALTSGSRLRRLTPTMIRSTRQVLISSCRAARVGHAVARNHRPDLQGVLGERSVQADLPQRLAGRGSLHPFVVVIERATPYARPYPEAASGSPQTGAGGPLSDCPSAAHEIEQRLNRSQAACAARALSHSTQCFFQRLHAARERKAMWPGAPKPDRPAPQRRRLR